MWQNYTQSYIISCVVGRAGWSGTKQQCCNWTSFATEPAVKSWAIGASWKIASNLFFLLAIYLKWKFSFILPSWVFMYFFFFENCSALESSATSGVISLISWLGPSGFIHVLFLDNLKQIWQKSWGFKGINCQQNLWKIDSWLHCCFTQIFLGNIIGT